MARQRGLNRPGRITPGPMPELQQETPRRTKATPPKERSIVLPRNDTAPLKDVPHHNAISIAEQVYEIASERGDLTLEEVQSLLHFEFSLLIPTFVVRGALTFLLRKRVVTKTWRADGRGLVRIYYKVVSSPGYLSHLSVWKKGVRLVKRPLLPKKSLR